MKSKLDIIGSALSIGCIIHCLLLPIILPVFPMLFLSGSHNTYFHAIMLIFVLGSSIFAFISGYKKHHESIVIEAGLLGNLVLVVGLLAEVGNNPNWLTTTLTVLGGFILIGTHYINHKYICACDHHCKGNHNG